MTVRNLGSTETDFRYKQGIEYQPVNVFNDSGISEIPASGDHTHQLFDAGINLEPYYIDSCEDKDSNKPAKMYRAGNHVVVAGSIHRNESNSGSEVAFDIFQFDSDSGDELELWRPAFVVSTVTAAVAEFFQSGSFHYRTCKLATLNTATTTRVRATIFNALGFPDVYIGGFSWRTDNEITTEVPPDSTNVFTWDVTPWDGHVWA